MYLKQSLAAVKPQYHAYRDGKNVVYTIEGDMTRHRFSVRQGENEVLVLHKKIAKLFAEYTIEKEGQEIAHIKKGLFRSLSGNVYGKSNYLRYYRNYTQEKMGQKNYQRSTRKGWHWHRLRQH